MKNPNSFVQQAKSAQKPTTHFRRMIPIATATLCVLMLAAATHAQTQVKLRSGDVVEPGGLRLRKSIAFDGNTVVVGSVDGGQAGSVYVYGQREAVASRSRSGMVRWGRLATLVAPGAGAETLFGSSVAVSGNTIVVGAPGSGGENSPGSAYIFQRDEELRAAAWSLVAQLAAPNASGGNNVRALSS